jgi:titin
LPIFKRILSHFVAGKPDPPRNLATTGVTETTAGLRWDPPELDGGSPITGYVVEMRTANKKTWNKVDTTSSLEFNVTGLTEGTEYVFHVAAQNAVGISDFVELEKGVTPKGKFGKTDLQISFDGCLRMPV